jgi:Type IX secretion system protein PorV
MRPTAFKLTAAILILVGITQSTKAQSVDPINVVTTAVPFLRISPDARAAGMGELAIAASPDANSSFWNLAKVPYNTNKGGISLSYTPWLKDILSDVYLASVAGFYKFDDQQAISGSLRYFSLGNIQFTDNLGNDLNTFRPREFGIDVGYSRKLNDRNGIGVGLKYIYSNLAQGPAAGNNYKAASAVAGDIAYYYDGHNDLGQGWAFGAVMSNLGSKISYTDNADQKDYIPANLGIGTTYKRVFNSANSLTFGVDLNKLMVPTPPADPATQQQLTEYRSKGVMSSWFSSFADAPGGFSEEIKEFQLSIGAEYWYNDQFALRTGYFYEDKTKGNRRYFTMGVGIKYQSFGLDFSYLLPSGSGVDRNPLSNTLRFSLHFNFDGSGATTTGN